MSVKEEDRKDESPSSWRLGLKKTGSYGALAEITARKEAQKDKDAAGVMRSASSPRLSSALDNKEKVRAIGTIATIIVHIEHWTRTHFITSRHLNLQSLGAPRLSSCINAVLAVCPVCRRRIKERGWPT